jgi:hypothetical protein
MIDRAQGVLNQIGQGHGKAKSIPALLGEIVQRYVVIRIYHPRTALHNPCIRLGVRYILWQLLPFSFDRI